MTTAPARRLDFRTKVSEFLDAYTSTDLFAPNQQYKRPTPDPSNPKVYAAWSIEEDDGEDFTFGCIRIFGEVSLWVWAQKGSGDERVAQLHDELEEIFRNVNDDDIDFMPSRAGDGFTDAGFYGKELVIPYQRFEAA